MKRHCFLPVRLVASLLVALLAAGAQAPSVALADDVAQAANDPVYAADQPPVAAHPAPAEDAPNVNPVELGAVEVPRTEDGKYDATRIADPADFGDWDEQGCKG